jgi:hypothetical protein
MSINFKVSLAFVNLNDAGLDDFTTPVVTGIGLPVFAGAPVNAADLGTLQVGLRDAGAACAQGGSVARALRNAARLALENALRQDAAYVQSVAGTDLATLLSSGFYPTSTNRAQVPLVTPVILGILNSATRELTLQVGAVAYAKSYEAQISTTPGVWVHAGTFANTRNMVLGNLTPGTVYAIQVRAIGGSTGRSNWSDPVSHMAI